MSATCYKRPHVNIFICIEMGRVRNQVIKKHNTRYFISSVKEICYTCLLKYNGKQHVRNNINNIFIIHKSKYYIHNCK